MSDEALIGAYDALSDATSDLDRYEGSTLAINIAQFCATVAKILVKAEMDDDG